MTVYVCLAVGEAFSDYRTIWLGKPEPPLQNLGHCLEIDIYLVVFDLAD